MLNQFQNHLHDTFPFLADKKLLLAISGGIDSMVMVHLLQQTNFQIGIAHCNFQLRGLDSFDDQKFVQDYADDNDIPIYSTTFDTNSFAEDYRISIQMAARELRYNWFYELLENENYDYILTAHHSDDNLETFIINLSRGTGIDGLSGIPAINDRVIRPLLCFSRQEIETYAKQNGVAWREDSSNASTKYLRNKIRHDLIPVLKDINPDFLKSFQTTQAYLQEAQQMVADASILIYQQVAKEEQDQIHFNLKKLKQLPNYHSYLFQWLKNYGFSDWSAISDLIESQSGKVVVSSSFRLLKDRTSLILSSQNEKTTDCFYIEKGQNEVKIPLNMTFCKVSDISASSNSSIFVDEDKLSFPMQVRKWEIGDLFQPYGMNGQTKKLSKLFKDEKMSLFEKESTWLLCSNQQIVWVIGIRADERFKIDDSTKNIIKISLFP